MIDFIYQNESFIRLSFFLGGFCLLASWEWFKPKRKLTQQKFKRWMNNFGLLLLGTVLVRILVPAAAVGMAYVVEKEQWGIMNHFDIPFWFKALVTFILLDLIIYFQHAMFHVLPVLWRLHRVHHSDLDCDISTGLRFHPAEILISIFIKFAVIISLGVPVITVILFEVILNLMSMFTHSNIYMNEAIERVLRWFVVTPDMHRIHHSTRENETNSNFGFNISLWDRIFSTYVKAPEDGQLKMSIGLDQFREDRWQHIGGLIAMPFSTKVQGYAINYRDNKNEKELALARKVAQHSQEKAKLASEFASYMKAIDQHAIVSVTDLAGKIIQLNDKFSAVSGYKYHELLYKDHRIVNSGTHPCEFFQDMWTTIASGKTWHGEICNRAKSGRLYWVDTTIVPIKDIDGNIERYVSVRIDITKRKQQEMELKKAYHELAEANSQLEKLNRIDELTQIANRRCFDDVLTDEVRKHSRTRATLSLILCDIDYFKNYNDTYGHLAGDDCLRKVAREISNSFQRTGDLVARYGGEEFAVILPNVDSKAALLLAERMRENIEQMQIEHTSTKIGQVITVSVGVVSVIPGKNTSGLVIIDRADKALYKAKDSGRNNVQIS